MTNLIICGAVCFLAGWCFMGIMLIGKFGHERDKYNDPRVCELEDDTLRKQMLWQQAAETVRKFLP